MSASSNSNSTTRSSFSSALEERRWNRLGDMMSRFHEYFKREFNTVYELADGSFSRRGLSLPLYLRTARDMNNHLTMHHTIEERHIFPILAKKMPQFSNKADGAHILSHKGIHDGLENLDRLISKWTEDPKSYSPAEMRECLDGFREVLFHHLDEEVADLRGESLQKYFTLEEVESIAI
ncbi:hemerythrin HHE cation binding domain-containing protein [Crucibulum laeve]|uniref:Hemerythrin HHE cation binding domain-containing protein n=1 Tax=Crucibulum laeve TaxID=68775 RepID=A0A5C3MH94_9AGAR|nr:hemerythrin HHE cation binding domain-containing protein [Crucibulum laeve]